MTGRRASDWLRSLPASEKEASAGGDRRASDRRSGDRRAPRRPIDPKFAATLINQVLPAGQEGPAAYPAPRVPRPGFVINVKA